MPDITPLVPVGAQIIQSYGPEGFRVSGTVFEGAVLVRPDRTQPWLGPEAAGLSDGVKEMDMAALSAELGEIDVLLLGCGVKGVFVPPSCRAELGREGLPVEAMSTGAACRTFNVLMAEGRRVAALLIPPQP